MKQPLLFSISSHVAGPMAGIVRVTLEMRLDELGEFARQIGEVSLLLHQNRIELKRNATEIRDYKQMKRAPLFIRSIERERRRLVYTRKCLLAHLELLEADNEEKRQDLLELQN